MVSSASVSDIFANLRADPENNRCIECSSENPVFTSVNNGCLICAACVPSHSALGDSISRVKAIDSEWSEDELKLMIAGGNSSLKEFFAHYNISNTPPNFKYLTRAANFYRDMLFVVAQDREYEHSCPALEEGVQLVAAASYPDLGQIEHPSVPNEEHKVEAEPKGVWGWAKSAYKKTVDVGNKAADKIGEKLNKLSEQPTIRKVENKTVEIAGKIESGLNHVVNKVYSKPEVQSAIGQVNHATESLTNEVKFTYTKINSNPSVQKLKMDTMKMLKDIKQSFQSKPSDS